MTKCGQSGIKIVYNYNIDDYIITGVKNCNLWEYPIRSFNLIGP